MLDVLLGAGSSPSGTSAAAREKNLPRTVLHRLEHAENAVRRNAQRVEERKRVRDAAAAAAARDTAAKAAKRAKQEEGQKKRKRAAVEPAQQRNQRQDVGSGCGPAAGSGAQAADQARVAGRVQTSLLGQQHKMFQEQFAAQNAQQCAAQKAQLAMFRRQHEMAMMQLQQQQAQQRAALADRQRATISDFRPG